MDKRKFRDQTLVEYLARKAPPREKDKGRYDNYQKDLKRLEKLMDGRKK
jgi:hypothetical protein